MNGGEPRKTALFRGEGGWDIPPERGRALLEQARQAAHGAGGSERFLQEDVALR
jgi:hypothetical protein